MVWTGNGFLINSQNTFDAGVYTLLIMIQQNDKPNLLMKSQTIKVTIIDPCFTTVLDSVFVPDITYCVGSPTQQAKIFAPKNSVSLMN